MDSMAKGVRDTAYSEVTRGATDRSKIDEMLRDKLAVPDSIRLRPKTVPKAGGELDGFLAQYLQRHEVSDGKKPWIRDVDVQAVIRGEGEKQNPSRRHTGYLSAESIRPILEPGYETALDKSAYISSKLTQPICELMMGGSSVELHAGSVKDCVTDLHDRGYTRVRQIRPPRGPLDLFIAENEKTGDYTFAIPNLYGGKLLVGDALVHYQANIMALGVDDKQVTIVDHNNHYRQVIKQSLSQIPKTSGVETDKQAPNAFIIGGYAVAVELSERWNVAGEFQKLINQMRKSPDGPLQQLRQRIDSVSFPSKQSLTELLKHPKVEELFRLGGADSASTRTKYGFMNEYVFRDFRNARWARRLVDAVKQAKNEAPDLELPEFGDRYIPRQKIPSEVLPIRNMVYLDSGGQERNLTYSAIPYGNLTAEVYKELVEQKTEKIFFVGTSGWLGGDSEDVPVGSIGFPTSSTDHLDKYFDGPDGTRDYAQFNPAISNFMTGDYNRWLLETGGVLDIGEETGDAQLRRQAIKIIPTNHISLRTALSETPEMVRKLRTGFYDTVDIEVARLHEAHEELAGEKGASEVPTPDVVLIISDIPGKEGQTINTQSLERMRVARELYVDHIIKSLGIVDIKPVGKTVLPK